MMMTVADPVRIAARVQRVRERVAAAAARAGRAADEIMIVAASKTHPPEAIAAVVAAGLTDAGENRVQEWRRKRDALAADGVEVRWHFIGALQRNKVSAVAGEVALIHSVDSVRLAEAIAARARSLGTTQDVLVEVNVSGESTKQGAPREMLNEMLGVLDQVEGIRLRGLMTIPPAGDLAAARAAFRWLRERRDALAAGRPGFTELSMGMSDDVEVAIEEGSTLVRIGTAIFGPRGS